MPLFDPAISARVQNTWAFFARSRHIRPMYKFIAPCYFDRHCIISKGTNDEHLFADTLASVESCRGHSRMSGNRFLCSSRYGPDRFAPQGTHGRRWAPRSGFMSVKSVVVCRATARSRPAIQSRGESIMSISGRQTYLTFK